MEQENYTTRHQKGKHINYDERIIIQLRLNDGWSPYRIAKELGCASNTVRNGIERGTVSLYHGKVKKYKASFGQKQYGKNLAGSRKPYKIPILSRLFQSRAFPKNSLWSSAYHFYSAQLQALRW